MTLLRHHWRAGSILKIADGAAVMMLVRHLELSEQSSMEGIYELNPFEKPDFLGGLSDASTRKKVPADSCFGRPLASSV